MALGAILGVDTGDSIQDVPGRRRIVRLVLRTLADVFGHGAGWVDSGR